MWSVAIPTQSCDKYDLLHLALGKRECTSTKMVKWASARIFSSVSGRIERSQAPFWDGLYTCYSIIKENKLYLENEITKNHLKILTKKWAINGFTHVFAVRQIIR